MEIEIGAVFSCEDIITQTHAAAAKAPTAPTLYSNTTKKTLNSHSFIHIHPHQRKPMARKPSASIKSTTELEKVVVAQRLASSSKEPELGAIQVATTGMRLMLDMNTI